MLGQSEPGSDPDYTYEKDTKKTGGGGGYADVWKKGHFAWEFKSRGANLDRAVWDAYGWPADEVPADVPEEAILELFLALNLDRQ